MRLEDEGAALGGPGEAVRFERASHEEDDGQPRDRAVDRRVAALYAARAERDALERNREGRFAEARRIVEECVRHIQGYAGDDPEILGLVENLREKAARYGRDMDAMTRKRFHSASSRGLKERRSPERLAHDEARGCFFDFCADRGDVERKLRSAGLCPPCRHALQAAGLPLDRLERLLEVVRTLAVPASVVH